MFEIDIPPSRSQVYVSPIFTRGQPFEERTSCCSYTHGVVTLLVKKR